MNAPRRTDSIDPGEQDVQVPDVLPVLPLKDTVLFPYIILPLSISRDKSVLAVDRALAEDRVIMLVSQRNDGDEEPREEDLHQVGTAAVVMRMLKLPDGRIRILVQGVCRARVLHLSQTEPYLQARIERLEDESPPPPRGRADSEGRAADSERLEIEALERSVKENLDRIINLGKGISADVMVIAANLDDPGRLADLAASNLELPVLEAQQILETPAPLERLRRVNDLLAREVQVLTMQQEISSLARGEMDRTQREYYLRQQLKTIQDELGEGTELAEEAAAYRQAALEREMSAEALEEMEKQIRRLERSHPESAETSVLRTYLDWLTGLPWCNVSPDRHDLRHARKVLDQDHYDLEPVKERILEYLAVRKLKPDARGPILCFVGPPGVGKTSLGRSIARSLGREFVRISLGGVRDEAEIRGHRRTYVGALPGRIIQGIQQAGTSNPVFMLDEIDKLGADYRGDPSAALLEVLDPEQNDSFADHYLGVPYDLSRVIFIATANLLDPIHPAFRDRMEVIRLSGYTPAEKLMIARRHLIPKQVEEHGLSGKTVRFTEKGIRKIIREHTREAGLRNLERELAAVCRKVAMRVADGDESRVTVNPKRVESFLGPAKHTNEELLTRDRIGVATGLSWTEAGGDLIFIEVVAIPGKGKLLLTGQLGDVMRESAQAALTYARSYADAHGHDPAFFSEKDLHIHVPAGSIPKDGPSAGITIATAIASVLTGRSVSRRIAMTGEITLRGDVLPIGGLKEKAMAAKLAGIQAVILPKLNQRDLEEVPETIREGVRFHFAEHIDAVLELALAPASASPSAQDSVAASAPASARANRRAASEPAAMSGRRREPGGADPPDRPESGNETDDAPQSEDRLVSWLRAGDTPGADRIGDDAALLEPIGPWAITVDTQIAGVHFPEDLAPAVLARRLLQVNLSDLAAMGARPKACVLALIAPPGFDRRAFHQSLAAACREHRVALVGGDSAAAPTLTAVLTLWGEEPEDGRWLRRDVGRPGDRLWVGGTLGESALGCALVSRGARLVDGRCRLPEDLALPDALADAARRAVERHLAPRAQLALGSRLAARAETLDRALPALDLSDGLAKDLHRLCAASGVGARVRAAELPTSRDFDDLADFLGIDALGAALGGGEDYVLLFGLPEGSSPPESWGCHEIGFLTEDPSVRLERAGDSIELEPLGWDHLEPDR